MIGIKFLYMQITLYCGMVSHSYSHLWYIPSLHLPLLEFTFSHIIFYKHSRSNSGFSGWGNVVILTTLGINYVFTSDATINYWG